MESNANKELMELIASVRARDDDAFAKLVEQYKPMLLSVIHSHSLDERDAFSELCMSFHSAILDYKDEYGLTFGLYAKICVDRTAVDIIRRQGRERAHVVDVDFDVDSIAVPGGVQFMLEHRERSAHFLSVAKRVLSELEFNVYRYWMLGYKTSEIASALGASAKTVDNAKNRMWKKLRSHLTPED